MDEAIPDRDNKDLEVRSNGYIWTTRIFQAICAIVVLANDAKVASQWSGIDCSTPPNIAYIIAIVSTLPPCLRLALLLFIFLFFLLRTT